MAGSGAWKGNSPKLVRSLASWHHALWVERVKARPELGGLGREEELVSSRVLPPETAPRSPTGRVATDRRSCSSTERLPITRWRPLLPYLESHTTVHAMDRRGRGGSGDGEEYALERDCNVAAVVDAVAEASESAVDVCSPPTAESVPSAGGDSDVQQS